MWLKFRLFVDSDNGVDIYPEWDGYHRPHGKDQSNFTTANGRRFAYTWGQWKRFEIDAVYMPKSDRAIVNSWWWTGTKLLWMREGGASVFSVTIVNDSIPVSRNMPGYTDFYKARIELETY